MSKGAPATNPRKRMDELDTAIRKAIAEAEAHADKHNLSFDIYPAYGMGGHYDGEEGKWYPSSESC